MEHEFPYAAASKKPRNPLPRRGQIKAKIIGGLVRSIVAIGSKKAGRARNGQADGGGLLCLRLAGDIKRLCVGCELRRMTWGMELSRTNQKILYIATPSHVADEVPDIINSSITLLIAREPR